MRFLRDFYASAGQEPDGENLEFKALRNRRWIWMNCERIVREIEAQRGGGCGHGVGIEVESSESKAED